MSKSIHFSGQPMYGQLISLIDKEDVLKFSRKHNGERYVKHFDACQHLLVMLYAVIKRFDSLREVTDSMFPEARKLAHIGIRMMPRRSTLSDANARRPEAVFEDTYRSLYARYKDELSSDSRKRQAPSWLKRLQIIDSTTISLFSNLIFKGVGRNPKTGKKKGCIKVHTNIHASAFSVFSNCLSTSLMSSSETNRLQSLPNCVSSCSKSPLMEAHSANMMSAHVEDGTS